MNTINVIVQSKDDPKNILSTVEKADSFPNGLSAIFMENATLKGQLGIELVFKGEDLYGNETIVGHQITENNFEALMGAFIGVRMRFGRMPEDQWEMVRHYLKDQVERFLNCLSPEKRRAIEFDAKRFFRMQS